MIDQSNILSTSAETETSSMIESFRAIGNSFEIGITEKYIVTHE
jgi:hypothetical protein